MNVGERLIELRNIKGITTNRLANLAGVSQSHLREIELGKRNPTVETLSYFCEVLGVSLDEFFREDGSGINPVLATSLRKLTDEQQIKLAKFLDTL